MPSLRVSPISRNFFYFVLLLYSQEGDLDAMLTGQRGPGLRSDGDGDIGVRSPYNWAVLRSACCHGSTQLPGNTTTACWPAATEFQGQHSSIVLYSLYS